MGCSEVAIRYLSSSDAITYVYPCSKSDPDIYSLYTHLVQFIVKLIKLRRLCHLFFIHEKRGLDLLIASFSQKVETILNKSLDQVDAVICKEVPPMTSDLGA